MVAFTTCQVTTMCHFDYLCYGMKGERSHVEERSYFLGFGTSEQRTQPNSYSAELNDEMPLSS